jgi:hypothetical protein
MHLNDMPDLPDPNDAEGLRDFFQDVLGPDYEVSLPETIAEDDHHIALGMVVKAVGGELMSGNEVVELFRERGIEVAFGLPDDDEIPDTIPDDLTGSLDPTTLTDTYGPKAAEMVDQIGRLINVSWFEQYEILAQVVGHLKIYGLDEEQVVHLFQFFGYLPIAEGRNRQYLGALLEGYRRDNNLDADDLQTLVRAASRRVRDLVYGNAANEEEASEVTKMLRTVYLGDDQFRESWPPANDESIRTLYQGLEANHDDH